VPGLVGGVSEFGVPAEAVSEGTEERELAGEFDRCWKNWERDLDLLGPWSWRTWGRGRVTVTVTGLRSIVCGVIVDAVADDVAGSS